MMIGALGDIHGAFDTVQEIMARHADVPFWLQVGDVASNDGEYFTPVAPLYWIKGNNEDFDVVAAAIGRPAAGADAALPAQRRACIRWAAGASPRSAARSRRAGITRRPPRCRRPGASKSTTASLKLGKSRDDKRRHFVRDEVLACKALTGHRRVPDARGAAAVLSGGPAHRRGQDRASTRF